MPKQVKISDELYRRVKGYADASYRSIGQQIEYLLDQYEGIARAMPRTLGEHIREDRPVDHRIPVEVNTNSMSPKDIPVETPPVDGKAIVAKINELNKKIRDADTTNQDPDYWDVINGHKQEVDRLWQEFHKVNNV